MLARVPCEQDQDIIRLEPWQLRLRSALGQWERRKPAKPTTQKRRQMTKGRRAATIERVVVILKQGTPTKFSFEATCRHAIRSKLCLQGWKWADADAVAAEIVAAALNRIGAIRPTWQQAQPEWTQDGHSPIERTRCVRCHGNLPENHTKFCSNTCAGAHHMALARKIRDEETSVHHALAH